MDIQSFYEYCISLPGTSDGFPFDENTLVLKVMGKIFAITNVETFDGINLKCDPVRALEYRASYESVKPGYHMNKKHWNTVEPMGDVEDELLFDMIRDSYDLVAASLTKKKKEELASLSD